MPEPLDAALAEVRGLLLDPARLVRAVASGRRHGSAPSVVRAQLRPVALKAGQRLQLVADDGARPRTSNLAWGAEAERAVDALLAEPFGNWHVASTAGTLQLRVTKRGAAQVHRSGGAPQPAVADRAHDRAPAHLLDPGDPLFEVIGGGAAKRRQVDAFLRALAAILGDPPPAALTVADLGCGNAYLTFAAFRYLSGLGVDVRVTGVDVRADQRERNTALAKRLGCADRVRFVAGTIADAEVDPAPDTVLALHACDTATDEALARAVRWRADRILAAPCCHHDIACQLRSGGACRTDATGAAGGSDAAGRAADDTAGDTAGRVSALLRDGILRERFADVLTDALRAALLRANGYRVEVVEFTDSAHTPRNVLLRARRTGGDGDAGAEYRALASAWNVVPALARLLGTDPTGSPDRERHSGLSRLDCSGGAGRD